MMQNRTSSRLIDALYGLFDRARARVVNRLTLYLAKPVEQFATLTSADRAALATVLRPGDVLLSAGTTRCARVVKHLTRSTWSHVSMYVGPLHDAADAPCIVEADIAAGVRAIPLSQLAARQVCVLRPVDLDDAERARLAECVVRYIGSDYDLMHACVLAYNLLLRRWWNRLRALPTTMGRDAARFICSSLIAEAFALMGHSVLLTQTHTTECQAQHGGLVPADFERACALAIVWPVDARDALFDRTNQARPLP
jgi:hypothetical protein